MHLADELEWLVTLHDASTNAAVIVEPVAGSTGVLIPPRHVIDVRNLGLVGGVELASRDGAPGAREKI
ncbi:hypothetical protein [Paraburkholderia domus]|uniref:hypothetical protein n=1 Tax=Paraburkholderia domus TaxID=2793075 RepID=UPI00191170AA|nr:hypothetical protein [Paraburkholderia domus]MBK5053156.1 hypothetical protein [Burkholderia sp. R-70006]MBK5059670.1 hypothetical protein [Burkholderia sp. R-70199]MBK5089060.1 hypothetical protein [Burkholderia sp. R-69927]MBK5123244.1 hypothetical protein [Burkholderia sp. R-69980]MBK5165109.1 hypothetical protein [Burkholderia sp. R-70211]MCI0145690.1 hypothetical protein [Paraburkholderia sediminicola]